jgi:glycosyltransferase involved in cell wall biosynthesis
MIGIVIPAHDEECLLESCLRAAMTAARHPALLGEPARVLVVLDASTDGSAAIAQRTGVESLAVNACNVGVARAAGASWMLAGLPSPTPIAGWRRTGSPHNWRLESTPYAGR